ncbi:MULTISPECIES: ABC transporter permease [Mycobacterium]|uniref:Sulfonate ABC transporter, permease n=1 Tax=Mycobacterium kiyosense TaxID=2871094 RepID=A0A9P3Q504_9MYCO|nr:MULTISPECIES: ABC transporter permease [Mycobacterium]BDB41484.1 putative sulfonate ABC transporter, permease [Mycobacterium kiyosense]BDE15214.1 putative sulfonate ABC transporter, permease [Mycobacterium sp. 20KCMC460]GLB81696.1 putative sulfonate ABC transporter, permease [Mycobacterium kiyosense]GLB87524.1 putative sulfonate ABC transporter, permease [Mycobacterium kiyosense]GLB94276.1 putative sulfonate ABC transporter, permease [Mycobacterium kiyosense]
MTLDTATASAHAFAGAIVRRWWPPALAIGAAVALWWLATAVLAPAQSLLRETTPDRVIRSLADLFNRGVLLPDTGVSLWRLLIGLLVGVVLGVPAGLLIGLNDTAERATRPVVQFLRMISPLSWAPISVALFGIGNEPVIFLIAAASVWPILINTAAGVHAVEPGYLQVARSLGATRVEQLRVVVLPAIRGHLQTGLRVALGIAWVVLVPAEMLGVRSGLGYQILNARDQLAYGQVVAVIVVIGVIGYVLDLAARRLLSGSRTDRQS